MVFSNASISTGCVWRGLGRLSSYAGFTLTELIVIVALLAWHGNCSSGEGVVLSSRGLKTFVLKKSAFYAIIMKAIERDRER